MNKEKKRRAPRASSSTNEAAASPGEVALAGDEDSVPSHAVRRIKKQRTAAVVAAASFAAIRTAEESQNDSQLQSQSPPPTRDAVDNSYERDVDEEEDQEPGNTSPEEGVQELESHSAVPEQEEETESGDTTTGEEVALPQNAAAQGFVTLTFVTDRSFPKVLLRCSCACGVLFC